MTDQDIKGPGYRVWYDAAARTLHFEGMLRLATSEYRPIDELLEAVLKTSPAALHSPKRVHVNGSVASTAAIDAARALAEARPARASAVEWSGVSSPLASRGARGVSIERRRRVPSISPSVAA